MKPRTPSYEVKVHLSATDDFPAHDLGIPLVVSNFRGEGSPEQQVHEALAGHEEFDFTLTPVTQQSLANRVRQALNVHPVHIDNATFDAHLER